MREVRFCLPLPPPSPRVVSVAARGGGQRSNKPLASSSAEGEEVSSLAGRGGSYVTSDQLSHCRVFETCDHAVLIAGAWNEWTQRSHQTRALLDVYTMLRRHHVKRRTIRVFYANGGAAIEG